MAPRRSEGLTELVDSIYEAAFWPEGWVDVLSRIGLAGGSASGLLMVFDNARPVQFRATPLVHGIIEAAATAVERPNKRAAFTLKNPFRGFIMVKDYFPSELLDDDPGRARRLAAGLDSEASAVIPMATGEMAVFSFDRRRRDGPHRKRDLAALNGLYPHMARSALIASRLGLERAATATTTLQAIGLPAAVLSRSGRVMSTNAAFDRLSSLFLASAHGGLTIADKRAHGFLQEIMGASSAAVRSIPIAGTEERPACVIHVLPLRRNAHEIFSGADTLLAVTTLRTSVGRPSPAVLESLFDLTASEVAFASALLAGLTVQEASEKCGLTGSSGRTYLARIFAKTGTHRQPELMALLASAHPFEHGHEGSRP